MGGNRQGPRSTIKRDTVEDGLRLDLLEVLRAVPRHGPLQSLRWTHAGREVASIRVEVLLPSGLLVVRYTVHREGEAPEAVEDWLALEASPMPRGGVRWFGRCPGCGRRVAKLYLPRRGARFRCRACHELTYRSSQGSSRLGRAFRRLLREALG